MEFELGTLLVELIYLGFLGSGLHLAPAFCIFCRGRFFLGAKVFVDTGIVPKWCMTTIREVQVLTPTSTEDLLGG